jgi:hypothetical protein
MSRNYQRQLALLDTPAGDLRAFKKEGGKIRLYDMGGSPSTPEKTTQVVELPDWAKGYAKDTLAKGSALTDISKNPYQQYGGERIAGFQPLQQRTFETAEQMQPSQQVGLGSSIAGAAGLGALNTNYQGGRFYGGQFNDQAAQDYMDPYAKNVVDYQKAQALRDFQIAQPMRQAQAVQQGAFGGSRSAIIDAEAQRSLNSQLQGIEATGRQAAFQNAQQQFERDQARRLQAQGMGEQSRQYGAGLGMQGLQTGLQAAGQLGQLGQNEYGQRMGITQLQSQLGTQQQQQAQRPLDMAYQDFLNQQNYPYKQLGFMSDMIRGLPLGQQSAQSVYQGSGNVMGQLAGIGMGAYGLSRMGAFGSDNKNAEGGLTGYADGGEVKTYAGDYGSVTSEGNVQGIIRDLGDLQLQQAKEAALNARDEEQAQMIDQEIARRANLRSTMPPEQFAGIAPALSEEFADGMEQSMATGGIVAFAGDDGSFVIDPMLGTTQSTTASDDDRTLLERLGLGNRENRRVLEASEAATRKREQAAPPKQKLPQMSPEDMAKIDARNAAIKSGIDVNKDGSIAQPKKQAKPRFEDITAGPKPSKKEVKSAVAQFAEQNNLGTKQKEDAMTTALKIRDELGKPYQPILDKLNAAIEAQKPNEQAMKDRGLAQALTQFGFGMAERASKPGARFLESASGAAPVIGTVVAETNKLIEAKKDNYAKMQLDQAKYEVALSQGNMQIAATMAAEIRRSQQQDKLLDFNIAKAKDELALKERELAQQAANQAQMLGRYETIGSLTRDIMRNEGLPYPQALEKAARLHRPTGYAADVRAETTLATARAKAIEKAQATPIGVMLARTDPSNPKYPAMKAKFDAEVQRQLDFLSPGLASTSGSPPPSSEQDGFGPMKVK